MISDGGRRPSIQTSRNSCKLSPPDLPPPPPPKRGKTVHSAKFSQIQRASPGLQCTVDWDMLDLRILAAKRVPKTKP